MSPQGRQQPSLTLKRKQKKTKDGLRFLGQQPCALVHLGRAGEFLCLSPQTPNPTFHNAEPLGKMRGRCCPQGVSAEGLC